MSGGQQLDVLHLLQVQRRRASDRRARGRSRQLSCSASRIGASGCMLIACSRVSLLFLTGQISTQSRAAGAIVGRHLEGVALLGQTRPSSAPDATSTRPARPASRRARRPWRESPRAGRPARTCRTGCRCRRPRPGTSVASARFSHWAVPVGYVPSTGNALTGSASPCPSIRRAVTVADERRASAGTAGRRSIRLVAAAGIVTSCEMRQARGRRRRSSSAPPPRRGDRRSSRSTA